MNKQEAIKDLIKRSDALAVLHDCWWDTIEKADEKMKELPAIEAEPKHGRWLLSDKGDCIYTCSECGFVRDAYILEEKAYCPNCGAYMREVKNETDRR